MEYIYILMKWSSSDGCYEPRSAHVSKKAAEAQITFKGWSVHACYIQKVEFFS